MKSNLPIKVRDRVVPIVEKLKALNRDVVIKSGEVFTVLAMRFDRKRREWILFFRGGIKVWAKFFRKVTIDVATRVCHARSHRRQKPPCLRLSFNF